jgi:hypothetical protein
MKYSLRQASRDRVQYAFFLRVNVAYEGLIYGSCDARSLPHFTDNRTIRGEKVYKFTKMKN